MDIQNIIMYTVMEKIKFTFDDSISISPVKSFLNERDADDYKDMLEAEVIQGNVDFREYYIVKQVLN